MPDPEDAPVDTS